MVVGERVYLKYSKILGIEKYVIRFSTHDPAKLGQNLVDVKPKTEVIADILQGIKERRS